MEVEGVTHLIQKFKDFFEKYYISKITQNIREDKKRVTIEFFDLAKYDEELAERLIEQPEDTLTIAELAIEQMDIDGSEHTRVRVRGDIPNSKIRIRDLKSNHLNRFITVEGTIETKTDMAINMTSIKYECPSCMPKGTLVFTPEGYKPIESVKEVISLDENFKPIKIKAKIVNNGKKQIWKINDWIECSAEHNWFVYRKGITQVIHTKDLNIGDVLYKINDNLYNLQQRIYSPTPSSEGENRRIFTKKNVFKGLRKKILQYIPNRRGKNQVRQQRNNQIIYPRKEVVGTDSKHIIYPPQVNKKEINQIQDTIKDSFRTMQDKCEEFNYLQAWNEMWRKRFTKVSKKIPPVEMQEVRSNERKITKERFGGSSYKQKTSRQHSRKFNGSLSISSYQITSIDKTSNDTEMYDLIIPRYNNFIIFGGIVTHNCGNIINVLQTGENLVEPLRCGCGRKGKFHLVSKELQDFFTLRIQELSSSIKYGSSMPIKSILCKGDLTDAIIEERLIEGLKVKINGIYKEKVLIKNGKKQNQLVTYIEANYIQLSDESFYDIELTKEDIEEIKEFSQQPHLIEKIYKGIFQGVYGFNKIKEALVLQMFGGVSDYEAVPHTRGDIHILLVGDPGQNKSVFLEFVDNASPKSVLVVGKSVSAVGMSGAVIKDELSDSFVLKPGAIPLANNGIIEIDELDKMKLEDRDILHQPMEQQIISVSKANLPDRKMLARCSFLVSMNPKNGYFNLIDPIYNQIDLPPTLISRFDLVFVIKKSQTKTEEDKKFEKEKAKMMMTRGHIEKQKKLAEFHKFIRKYIAYAKQHIHPKFSKDLEEEYVPEKYAIFDYDKREGEFPITPRHLGIIRRLAEAHRRIFLEEKCIAEDVDYAIEKIRGSLEDIAIDVKTGKIDQEWVVDGVSTEKKKIVEVFDEICNKLVKDNGDIILDEFYHEMTALGFEGTELENFMKNKNRVGDIFYPQGERGNLMRRI